MADETNVDQTKLPWYQTELFKTIATIVVILMIPVAAFAWNVFSGNGSIDDIKDAFNISSSDTENDNDSNDLADGSNDTNNTENGNENADNETNNGTKSMPNTSAKVKHLVKSGDTLESISLSVCKNKNFYYANMDMKISEGQTINVNCNTY